MCICVLFIHTGHLAQVVTYLCLILLLTDLVCSVGITLVFRSTVVLGLINFIICSQACPKKERYQLLVETDNCNVHLKTCFLVVHAFPSLADFHVSDFVGLPKIKYNVENNSIQGNSTQTVYPFLLHTFNLISVDANKFHIFTVNIKKLY